VTGFRGGVSTLELRIPNDCGAHSVQEYTVDVSAAASWEEFIAAFNEGFISHVGGSWNGNLDAFHDYLWWPEEHPYRLVVRGWHHCHPVVNRRHRTWDDKPILDVIEEIFRDNPQAQVVLV
jgi:hypothetical protein